MRTYYHILNISPRATDEQVRRAYRALARRYHPDRNPGHRKAHQAFIHINRAYSMLKTKPQRDAYNRFLLAPSRRKPGSSDLMAQDPGFRRDDILVLKVFAILLEIFWPFTLQREAPHG